MSIHEPDAAHHKVPNFRALPGITCSASAGRTGLEPGSPDFAAESFTWMASMTKIITATCIMMLVERGTLALDEDVRRRVPELGRMQILRGFDADDKPVLEDNVRPITTRQVSFLPVPAPHGLRLVLV